MLCIWRCSVCMYVGMYVCMYAWKRCVHACRQACHLSEYAYAQRVRMHVCMHACMYVCIWVSHYVCSRTLCICIYSARVLVLMHVNVHVRMDASTYVGMHVNMYVRMHVVKACTLSPIQAGVSLRCRMWVHPCFIYKCMYVCGYVNACSRSHMFARICIYCQPSKCRSPSHT